MTVLKQESLHKAEPMRENDQSIERHDQVNWTNPEGIQAVARQPVFNVHRLISFCFSVGGKLMGQQPSAFILKRTL